MKIRAKTPLVSVIVTTRNEDKNIGRFLESVLSQTYEPLEIIVVDNDSTDKTKAIAKKYTKKVFNFGPERSAQRNLGAKKANGKYLVILDADMELTKNVVADCVSLAISGNFKAITIPEKTVGEGFISKIRAFEREMYTGDKGIELARFFDKKVFLEFEGYDLELTGPEDYDLPYRISKKYPLGRAREYILHHEEGLTLQKLLSKKYYYASRGAVYARKHPELIWLQGNLLFRKAYLRNWKRFITHPVHGILFIFVRTLEAFWAIAGFISSVGPVEFVRILFNSRK